MTRVGFSPKPGISETEAAALITTHIASDAHPYARVVSEDLKSSNDTIRTSTSATYEKKKETLLNGDISPCRVKWRLQGGNAGCTELKARLYKNGSPIGTEQTESGNDTHDYTEDFSGFVSGDLIQIYCKTANFNIQVSNLQLYYGVAEKTVSVTSQDP